MVKFSKPVIIGSIIGTIIGSSILIKDFCAGNKYELLNTIDNKVVIVTGANTGIGKETARELARRKGKIYMACRDLTRCEVAREEIVLETKNKYVYCRKCDLASQESIREFVTNFKKEQNQLHILVNNAGVMRCPPMKTKEGIELQLGVNHMGHFLLTLLLVDLLKKSAPSRIINVSSIAHFRGRISKEDLNSEKNYDDGGAYAQSKLANILFSNELARRLEGTGVTVNSVHPGIVETEITRHMSFFNSSFSGLILKPILRLFLKNPAQGAQTTLYAALSPELEKVTGKYFANCEESKTSQEAQDESLARWLWAVSLKWTKLEQSSELNI